MRRWKRPPAAWSRLSAGKGKPGLRCRESPSRQARQRWRSQPRAGPGRHDSASPLASGTWLVRPDRPVFRREIAAINLPRGFAACSPQPPSQRCKRSSQASRTFHGGKWTPNYNSQHTLQLEPKPRLECTSIGEIRILLAAFHFVRGKGLECLRVRCNLNCSQ